MKIFANNMLKGFCRFVLGKICDINIAYLGTKLIKKLNEMIRLSVAVATYFQ